MATSATSATNEKAPFRKICFTQHDAEEPQMSDKLTYLAYAKETCPTTGKEHWQGFAYARQAIKLGGWKKLFPGAHIEIMRSDFAANAKYCSKEGQLIEHGQRPRQGERTDLTELKVQLDAGKRPLEIARDVDGMFGVVAKHHRFAESYTSYIRRDKLKNDRTLPEVYIRWGPPGSGKTRWMDDTYGTDGWTRVPDKTGRWFNNCDCDVVLFDDVKANQIPSVTRLLELTDRYPLEVESKFGFITWKPRVIVITSNYDPKEWWPNEPPVSIEAFMRRITKCEHIV